MANKAKRNPRSPKVSIDIDVDSHNAAGRSRNQFRSNPRAARHEAIKVMLQANKFTVARVLADAKIPFIFERENKAETETVGMVPIQHLDKLYRFLHRHPELGAKFTRYEQNPRRRVSRHIPRKILKWGKRHLRSTKKTRADFEQIERKAAKRYGSAARGRAVAGAARWKRLRARYKEAHQNPAPRPRAQATRYERGARKYYVRLAPSEHGGLKFGLDRVTPVSWEIKHGIPKFQYGGVIPEDIVKKPDFRELFNAAKGKSFYASYSHMLDIFRAIREGRSVKVDLN